jgi:hypothetical protein
MDNHTSWKCYDDIFSAMKCHGTDWTLYPLHDLPLLLCNGLCNGLCCWARSCFFRSTVPIGLTRGFWSLHLAALCALDLAMGMIGLLQLVKLRQSGLRHCGGGCVQPWWKVLLGTGPCGGPCARATRFTHGLVTDLQLAQAYNRTHLVTGPLVVLSSQRPILLLLDHLVPGHLPPDVLGLCFVVW